MALAKSSIESGQACRTMVDLTIRRPVSAAMSQFLPPFGLFDASKDTVPASLPAPSRENPARASKLPEEDPLASIEKQVESLFTSTFAEISRSFNFEGIQNSIVDTVAEGTYKSCLAECVDDQRKVWPAKLSQCWIDAKTDEDAGKCAKMAVDLRRWSNLQGEIGRLEKELTELHSS